MSRFEVFPASVVRRDSRVTVIARQGDREFRALLRNTGRLEDLIWPGAPVLCLAKRGERTEAQVLGTVVDGRRATLLDTLVQARVIEQAVERGLLPWLPRGALVRREVPIGSRRLVYEIELAGRRGFLELKSAVHLRGDFATYPDAPSTRGREHIRLLIELSEQGHPCLLAFIAAHPEARRFRPDVEVDPELDRALKKAVEVGVRVHALKLHLELDGRIVLDEPSIPVVL
ncbi:MAG: DNA/RNA nuclease SfsA [Candidatus Bipolaricaulia bacterium]